MTFYDACRAKQVVRVFPAQTGKAKGVKVPGRSASAFLQQCLHDAALPIRIPTMNTADTPTIVSHPPERRRRTEIRMCHGSACCCCCCLHTVGGIIGSAVAPAFGKDDVAGPNIAKSEVSAVKVFWLLSLAAALLGALIGALIGMNEGAVDVGLVILAMVFPAVQLVIAIITLIWLAMSSRQDKSFQAWQIGKITLGLFVGTGAGSLAMWAWMSML